MLKTLHETTCFLCSTQDHQRDSSFRVFVMCPDSAHTHTHTQIRRLSLSCCTPWQQNLQHLWFEDGICRTNWSYKIAHDFCQLKALHVFAGSQCHSDVGDMTFLEFFSERTPWIIWEVNLYALYMCLMVEETLCVQFNIVHSCCS
jgi:hypothetical protein